MSQFSDLSGKKVKWLSKVIDTLENVPFLSNVVLAFVLVCLEKLVETEFSCPCDHGLNVWIVAPYFVVPALLTFILMCFMLEFQFCDKNKCCGLNWLRSTFICSIPAIVWVSLLFFDGRYVACAATDWSGKYVTIDKNVNKKWCQPTNSSLSDNQLMKTQWWFGVSQLMGLGFLGLIIVLILIYQGSKMCCCKASGESTQDSIETLHGKLQVIEKAAKELEKAAESTRAAAEDAVNESAVKRAEAVKESAAAAEAAATAAQTVVAAVAKATAATESAGTGAGAEDGAGAGAEAGSGAGAEAGSGEVVPLIDISGHTQSAPQQKQSQQLQQQHHQHLDIEIFGSLSPQTKESAHELD